MQRTSRIKHACFWRRYSGSAAALLLSCAGFAQGQTIKATIVSAPIEGTSVSQWVQELGYQNTELYPLALTNLGCPLIEVDVDGTKIHLMFDSGTSRGFLLTNHAPDTRYRIEGRQEELNADGSHRGESASIRVEAMTVLGKIFNSVGGSLSEWAMLSSEPFDGTVGLDFFLDRRLTLDYRSLTVGATTVLLPEKLDPKRYITVDLIDPPKSQGHILYGRARVNGREAIVYFDTGYNVSFIDPEFNQGLALVERPGKFRIFREAVPVELGGRTFKMDDLREDPIRRGAGFDQPIAVTLGSDILSRFVITVDLRARKMILALSN